ncbi:hypothetical protein [Tuwongella immobilis]|uniref:Uncharacterized protein n=1 Tax=Tuwongella immobilis TaxID=692036 RepID=A0A6C2YGW3_9BACT|nr:hypothetical protein [Tuwongella immobilis]VIP00657.1 unnamed protein product [Tuwongella immobilis]VTR96732.1 unnamed protein product [Tuwongella immobilis]
MTTETISPRGMPWAVRGVREVVREGMSRRRACSDREVPADQTNDSARESESERIRLAVATFVVSRWGVCMGIWGFCSFGQGPTEEGVPVNDFDASDELQHFPQFAGVLVGLLEGSRLAPG